MSDSPRRPNLLLITSDQQHWRLLGAHTPGLKTPNLDRLAAQGTRYDRAYCPNPTCTPTRASLITGLYPSQHGAYTLGSRLPEEVPTIGDYLHKADYDCALIGKAHFQPLRSTDQYPSLEAYPVLQDLEFWRKFHGPFYGFNHIELARNHTDEAHVGQHYALWMEENGGTNWRDWFQPPTGQTPAQQHRWNIPERFHYNTWITERSIARLEQNQQSDTPFFLWASYFDPHPSYLVPEPWASMYDPAQIELPPQGLDAEDRWPELMRRTRQAGADFSTWQEPDGHHVHGMEHHAIDPEALRKDIAVYYGMMSMLDHYVGKLLDRLEELGLADNTLVVFTSDHGHYFGQHGLTAKGPFHFEDGIRVPFIVRWPGQVPAGRVSSALQSLVDCAPSLLEAAGVPVPGSMAGKSQLPVWRGDNAAARRHVSVEFRHQPSRLNLRTTVDTRYKITLWNNPEDGEIYDLETDPGEYRNLWSDPAASELKTRLLQQAVLAEMEKEPYRMPRVYGA
jgi:uncharacterized sulfatase